MCLYIWWYRIYRKASFKKNLTNDVFVYKQAYVGDFVGANCKHFYDINSIKNGEDKKCVMMVNTKIIQINHINTNDDNDDDDNNKNKDENDKL